MQSRLNPYIGFDGQAREAIGFYQTVLGGKLEMTTYAEGGMSQGPEDAERIMHAMLTSENGMVLMVSDAPPGMPLDKGSQISLSLSGDNDEELSGYWNKLADGATITAPFEKAPWGDKFGMLTDKYGINWMVNVADATHE